eukprot:TRINITY_DN60062_c0_g1_i1.p1 TRINITY_DN60062_c0_g1~~TRINITY_DN60062_c0_g1_i1.p1  ORF type:complete len:817 (-),score=74.02 TRINITY_DN60062_c0_g1_i1:414-2864(-)
MSAKKYEQDNQQLLTGGEDAQGPPTTRSKESDEKQQQMYTPMEKVKYKKTRTARRFLRETITYGLFMALFCIVTYTLRSTWTFYFTDSIRGSFLETTWKPDKNFYTLANTAEFFEWMDGVFLPTAYPETWYNGDEFDDYEKQFPMWYNYLVGKIRMRQLRVKKNEDCQVSSKFEFAVDTCYPPFQIGKSNHEPYGPAAVTTPNNVKQAFIWRDASELCKGADLCRSIVSGKAALYPPSGYAWDFSKSLEGARRELKQLQQARWIDYETRAIIIEFTLYNPNIRLICSSQMLVEFFPTGAVVTSDSIKPMSMLSNDSTKDTIIFVFEIVLVAAVAMYFFREVQEFIMFAKLKPSRCTVCCARKARREGKEPIVTCVEKECTREFNVLTLVVCPSCGTDVSTSHLCWKGYFQDFWNILDLVNQGFFIVVFYIRFSLRYQMSGFDFTNTEDFIAFYPIAWQYSIANWLNSVNALLCFFKTFKYLGKFKSLSTLVRTIAKARSDLVFFLIIFMVVFFGFALSYHLAFGLDLAGYRTWWQAVNTLFLALLGDFDFESMQNSNRVLAPVLFWAYQLMLYFVLANMFIAIISGAHEEAKEEIHGPSSRNDFLASSLRLFFNDAKLWLAKIGLLPKNTALFKVRTLISQLEKVDALTLAQIDDLRIFRNEIEHDPENLDLFNTIIHDFHGKVEKDMTVKDWILLKNSVLQWHRKKKDQVKTHIWDDDEMDPIEARERRNSSFMPGRQHSLSLSHHSGQEDGPAPMLGRGPTTQFRSQSFVGGGTNQRLQEMENQMDSMLAGLKKVTNMLEHEKGKGRKGEEANE